MNERFGVAVAIASSAVGAAAAVATRYLIASADPFTLAALRFGGGVICLLPLALGLRVRWPGRGDWLAVAGLGFMFFAVFFVFYNLALAYTTVARGTLALSTLPLMTMVVGAVLGIEALSARKTVGVLIAMLGVAAALASGLADAPAGAWRGDLIMAGATLCMALYNVWSRPFIQRSSALGFLTAGMGVGAAALVLISAFLGGLARVSAFTPAEWLAAVYLAAGGGALAFFLWVYALQYASPTRVANTMTVNPIVAGLLAALILGEPITLPLIVGLVAVFAGLWIATTDSKAAAQIGVAADGSRQAPKA
ncbi:MAG TPA: DMT family transporter [Xanthobacteraceae bacterium]|nr:DMT family transporter [Xanthobacteraceae bacterium]